MTFDRKRRLLLLFFAGVFLLVWARLVFWQIISAGNLAAQAEGQHFSVLTIPAKRGEIEFSDGTPLVANKTAYLLYANLSKVATSREEVATKLADVLAPEASQAATLILARLNLPGAVWVNLAHFLDAATRDKIWALGIAGLDFVDEETRDYPEASMAAHLAGFVGADENGTPEGYFGLEGFYERELAGKAGELRLEKDAFGRPIPIGSETRLEKQDGGTLVLTVDRGVQNFVETELQSGIKDWKAAGGTAVVMDPNTGAILALANFPAFDPRDFSYFPTSLYKDPAISDLFEPGSIFKPMVMAAALNEGVVTPQTRCDQCDGPRQIGGYYIHTFDNQYHPNETMTDVLVNSDNTGMIFVGEKLGFSKFYDYLKKFGLDSKTGVDLEGEANGNLRKETDYYPVDQATMTFGQGILTSTMQIVRGISVIANGGYLVTPHVVATILTNGERIDLKWPRGERIIKMETTKTLTEMLVHVANLSPEHFPKDRIMALANFRIAAKSGTAQIALGGKYKSSGTTASLVGYFPADNPKYLVMVKLNEPEVRPWGSDTAGPIFFSIVRDLIYYYNLTP